MMWCGREKNDNGLIAMLCTKVRAFAAPLFRKDNSERAPHVDADCFAAWLDEVKHAEARKDGSEYRAGAVLRAIAAGRMPPGA